MVAPHPDIEIIQQPLEEEYAVFDPDGTIKMSFFHSILDTDDTESQGKPKL
jgi:hypothetical protein